MSHNANDSPDVATPLIDKDGDSRPNTFRSFIADEFKPINLTLEYNYPGMFAQPQFGGQMFFFVWRVFAVILTIAMICICFTLDRNFPEKHEDRAKWLIYMTNWSLLVLMFSALAELDVTIYLHIYKKDLITGRPGSQPMPWFLKTCWVLYNMSTAAAFCISILFWTILYKSSKGLSGYHVTYIFAHVINSIYAFLNLLITSIPSRILHFYQPLAFAAAYGMFSAIYQAAGGTNYQGNDAIYPKLNWTHTGRTFGVVVAVLSLTVALHVVICLVAFIRGLVAFKFKAAFAKKSSRTEDSYQLKE